MKLFKKAKLPRIFSFIIVVLAVILLIYLIKNGWDMKAAAQDMLSVVGMGKK
jgi:hypothetical protein